MIKTKKDYLFYVQADMASFKVDKWKRSLKYKHPTLYFQLIMRKVEYLKSQKSQFWCRLLLKYYQHKMLKVGINLGLTIYPNTFGPGLKISHYGSIVVNGKVRVGKNCTIHSSTNIGQYKGKVPKIGHNVYIGPGAKIYGEITIGNNVTIGANSVVNKDVPDNVTVAGVPAKIIGEGPAVRGPRGADIVRKRMNSTQ